MAVHCTIVELLHTSRGNPRVKSPFGGCFWTKLQRPVRTIWKKKRMPSKLKTSKSFLWLEKNVYIQTSIDQKEIKKLSYVTWIRLFHSQLVFMLVLFWLEWFAPFRRHDLTALAWPLEVPPQRWPVAWWTRGFVEDVPSASAWWWGVPRSVAGAGKSPVSHHVSHHWCAVLFIGGKEHI